MDKDILYPLRVFHGWMHEYPAYRKGRNELKNTYVRSVKEHLKQHPNAVFLVMTPEHGNLGDQAIALSEIKLLNRIGIPYIEISSNVLEKLCHFNLLNIMNGHPIFVNGGGFLGTLWFNIELLLRKIIEMNPKSPIMLFPNTIFYEDSDWGREELKKSTQIYNRHKYLTIFAREKNSFELMKSIYRNVRLMPDMVLGLRWAIQSTERKGCLLCLRNDHEKTRTVLQEQLIREQAYDLFGEAVSDTDMIVSGKVPVSDRENMLNQKFNEFSGAQLVITDRLHGMIFCAITGTPCIVVNSKSPKVKGCYEWIKQLDYIRFVDEVSRITEEYKLIPHRDFHYDNTHLFPYYEELVKVVKEYAHN